ncbi:MAG: hypothetical protein A2Z83_07605 [Omnitrophica bacterium GWA2_52_8]|nr:MAG: hypothetical protein A2Z83_07605 [Omnitrophica bacterium GWA2_52_8]
MIFILYSCGMIFALIFSHMLFCRLRWMAPFDLVKFLSLCFFWLVADAALSQWTVSRLPAAGSESFFLAPFWMSSYMLYFLGSLWYLAQCTALQVQSPSMLIMQRIERHPEKAVTYEELRRVFRDEEFIDARICDLVQHGHIVLENRHYALTARGRKIAAAVRTYRNLIRRGMGG